MALLYNEQSYKSRKITIQSFKICLQDFTSSYAALRKLARHSLMYTESQRCILVEVYKCLNHITAPYLHDMLNVKDLP